MQRFENALDVRYADPNQNPAYLKWLTAWAKEHSDGCTGVLDIHVHCCWQHDYCYQTGTDPREAFMGRRVRLNRQQSDDLFRGCNQCESPFGRFSLLSWWRWAVLREIGWVFYHPKQA